MTGACNRNGCADAPTIIVRDTTGAVSEVFCLKHAVEAAEGLAARDRFFDESGREVIKLRVDTYGGRS